MLRICLSWLVLVFSVVAVAQNTSRSALFFKDYIITGKDTLVCSIDENTLDKSKIAYSLPSQPDKPQWIKLENISELKCRFVYKKIHVEGQNHLLKVLTEDQVSLYSKEKKGKTRLSDEEAPALAQREKAPARSTFYMARDGITTPLTNANYKAVLQAAFEGDEALQKRVDDLEFENLEFTLLNMVIRYNYRRHNPGSEHP